MGALWRDCSRVRVEVRAAMGALAGRVRLVAFTNDMAHWFGPDWPGRFPELAGFDQVVEAARLGVLKPDPEAFRLAAAEIGEAPERCLFVDDLAVNLDGAAAVGMQTLLFEVRDPAGSVAALLARLGIDPDPGPPGPAGCSASDELREGVRHPARAPAAGARPGAAAGRAGPGAARPAAQGRPVRGLGAAGDLLFLSGQGADGWTGRLGAGLTLDQGRLAARDCALNLLAQTRDALGSLDRVARVVKVTGFVACTPEFAAVPAVVDGASALLLDLFVNAGATPARRSGWPPCRSGSRSRSRWSSGWPRRGPGARGRRDVRVPVEQVPGVEPVSPRATSRRDLASPAGRR